MKLWEIYSMNEFIWRSSHIFFIIKYDILVAQLAHPNENQPILKFASCLEPHETHTKKSLNFSFFDGCYLQVDYTCDICIN